MSGVFTGGLIVLAVVVLAAAVLASRRAVYGPDPSMVVIHLLVAVAAVLAQVLGDRRGSGGAFAAGAAVLALSAVLLWTQWWA